MLFCRAFFALLAYDVLSTVCRFNTLYLMVKRWKVALRTADSATIERVCTAVSYACGQIVATPGALAALERAKQPPTCFLARHAVGDWGELEPSDIAENKYSLIHGFRLLSSYQTDAGEKLWIITEADRSATTLLLPDEY